MRKFIYWEERERERERERETNKSRDWRCETT